jgi:hypothetical protein
MISGEYHQRDEPLFAVDLARKDARCKYQRSSITQYSAVGGRLLYGDVFQLHLVRLKEDKS